MRPKPKYSSYSYLELVKRDEYLVNGKDMLSGNTYKLFKLHWKQIGGHGVYALHPDFIIDDRNRLKQLIPFKKSKRNAW